MRLEASVHKIREFTKTFAALTDIGDALEFALAAERKAESAEKRTAVTQAAALAAQDAQAKALEAGERLRTEAAEILVDAKTDAAAIRKEAKDKADALAAKSKDKADAQAEALATAAEKFAIQKQTNDEVLAMTNAQIAHAEAKLSELREAIARLTKG